MEAEGRDDWLITKLFLLDMKNDLRVIYEYDINFNFFTLDHGFYSSVGNKYFSNIHKNCSKVYMGRAYRPIMRLGLIYIFLAVAYKVPELLVHFLAASIERPRKHIQFLSTFRKLLKFVNLADFNLIGIQIALFGRVNGRNRK